jgi:K+-sensing histidine kinase KdpD
MVISDPSVSIRPERPWFHERRGVTLSVTGVLFAGIFLMGVTGGASGDAVSMLFVMPITLLAVAYGRRPGLLGALLAVALTGWWMWLPGADLSVLGWVSRVVPLVLVGGLVGDASDRLRGFEEQRRLLETSSIRHRQAVEINDSLVQGMAAAKWSIEAGRVETGVEMLTATLDRGQSLVSQLIRDTEQQPR